MFNLFTVLSLGITLIHGMMKYITYIHATGYAGFRDYLGTQQSPQKTQHISTHPTENRLGPSRKISVRVTYYFKEFANSLQNSCKRVGVCFSVGCVDRCSVDSSADCGPGSLRNPETRRTPSYTQRLPHICIYRLYYLD